ncbi:MAG: GNAT family N-acetyltransferase [Actinomycetes bacterium]
MKLVIPSLENLPAYKAALENGWNGDNGRDRFILSELAEIETNPEEFVAKKTDQEGKGAPIVFDDGTSAPRIPGYYRWMWDDGLVGSVNFRWQPGTTDLPPYCLGHVGYSVIASHRGKGYATEALRQILPEALALGMPHIDLTTDIDNVASQKVIQKNGGVLVGEFDKPEIHGGAPSYLWRIYL